MITATVDWTHWFHCESSFDLSLVPQSPGLFAVGREDESGTKLEVLLIDATEDLCHSIDRLLFSAGSLGERYGAGHLFLRYASVPDAISRAVTLSHLRAWMAKPLGADSTVVDEFLRVIEPIQEVA